MSFPQTWNEAAALARFVAPHRLPRPQLTAAQTGGSLDTVRWGDNVSPTPIASFTIADRAPYVARERRARSPPGPELVQGDSAAMLGAGPGSNGRPVGRPA